MNKTAFAISIALTTFVLMAVGGIVYAMRVPEQPQMDTSTLAPIDPGLLDPALEQSLSEREAAYQQMIAEANARIAQSQQRQQELQAQVDALQGNVSSASPEVAITPEQAAEIASEFLGQSGVYSVEATSMRGETLYKVTFYSGDIVYVSLDGQVVGSASIPPSQNLKVSTGNQVRRGGGGGEREGGEYEGGEYEDDD